MKRQHIAAGAVLLLVLVWYVALWSPEGSHLKAAQQRLSEAQAQVASAQEQLLLLRAEQPKLKAEKKVLADLVTALPNGPSLDQLLRTVQQAAVASGVDLTSLSTPQPSGWAAQAGAAASSSAGPAGAQFIAMSANVGGTAADVLQFVKALDSQPRIYVVTSFSLGTNATEQTNVTFDAFFVSGATSDPTFPGPAAP